MEVTIPADGDMPAPNPEAGYDDPHLTGDLCGFHLQYGVIIFPEACHSSELVDLIDIMLLGHWIEMRSVRQASGALRELAKLMPDTAERLLADGSTETIPLAHLKEGDLVLIRPGSSVSADGVVQEGESDVNEAMITGESRPVRKTPDSVVIAGTINGDACG
jgi:Cu2+-exporting ATPase